MIRSRVLWTVVGVGAVAFAAGRLAAPMGVSSVANAQEKAMQHEEMAPEMQAYMDAMTPGEHHRSLDGLVGDWQGEVKIWMQPGAEPMVMPATIHREWVLDGHYIQERVESHSEMGTFQGLGFIGYNNLDGQYEVAWLENQSTAIMVGTGSYDPASKVMATRGNHRDPVTGKMIYSRGELDMSNPKRQIMTDYATGPDGKEYLSFKGVFEKMEK